MNSFQQKLLMTMIPSQAEIQSIVEATQANPDKELGTAESFLMTMSSIPELLPRLYLWTFKLDCGQREQVRQLQFENAFIHSYIYF